MTDTERHRRAKALFLDLLALPVDMRAAALRDAAGADEELRREVESLLQNARGGDDDRAAVSIAGGSQTRPRFTAGDMFAGRYRIIEELGRGATGEVYRALDTRLDVEVALKIVRGKSPQADRRLLEEVRLARQVTHPAVCRVYDVDDGDGEHFLTMELVEGENLAMLLARVGRLSSPKVRQLGAELLGGLAAAHARGILHRDLKPSNVMLDTNGCVRLTDFGIASYEDRAENAPFAGTPDFMAPEQLERGAPASVQSDLYAAGLILYAALLGQLPEPSTPTGSMVQGSGARYPRPSELFADVDPEVEDVVMRLLSVDPDDRPRSAAAAAAELEGVTPSASRHAPGSRRRFLSTLGSRVALARLAPAVIGLALLAGYFGMRLRDWLREPPMWEQVAAIAGLEDMAGEVGIAVLPLADESEQHDQRALAEGVQDQIIARLEGIRGLRVIAEDSTDRFRARADVRKVGRALGVGFVSVGRIKGNADDPRVEIVLYDARDGRPVWNETYRGGAGPQIEQQLERGLITQVSDLLHVDVGNASSGASASAATAPDSATYTLYLRGREHVPPYNEAEFGSSVALLRQAIEADPQWGEPYAVMATAYVAACAIGWVVPSDGYPVARRYAERALALDGTLCEAHVAKAIVAGEYDWDWAAAEHAYESALELCPSSAWVHRSRGRFLATQGRFSEALDETSRALELDPTSALMMQGAAQRNYEARRYDRAVALARLARRLDPLYPYSYVTLGLTLVEQGRTREALETFDASVAIVGRNAADEARRAYAYARGGDRRSATLAATEAERLGTLDPTERALVALARDEAGAAVKALSEAVAAHAPPSIWLAVHPVFDPLRDREDFRALIEKVGLRLPLSPGAG